MNRITTFVWAILFAAAGAQAQTAAEILQKGIFAQETEGNLDSAARIFRQVVSSKPAQRDLAAQAQYRLGQILLQKGDLPGAAVEFRKLAHDFSDYWTLISMLAATEQSRLVSPSVAGPRVFDPARPLTVSGVVTQVSMRNPLASISVDSAERGSLDLALAAPNMLVRNQRWTKDTLKVGDRITATGFLASEGNNAMADTIAVDGRVIFNRADLGPAHSDARK